MTWTRIIGIPMENTGIPLLFQRLTIILPIKLCSDNVLCFLCLLHVRLHLIIEATATNPDQTDGVV